MKVPKEIRAIRVTVVDLEAMVAGEPVTFVLPDAKACNSGKTLAYNMAHQLRCRFTASTDYNNRRLTLTKHPRR